MSTMKLFFHPISPPSRAAFMVATALRLKFVAKEVNIFTKEYTKELSKINPQHTVPTLQDNNFILWDSHAIAAYLVNNYGEGDELYPRNVRHRAIVDQRLHFDTGVLYPTLHTAIIPILFRNKYSLAPINVGSIRQAYAYLNTFLKKGKWLCGKDLTIADICCSATISTLDFLYPVHDCHYPELARFLLQAEEIPYIYQANNVGLEKLGKEITGRIIAYNKLLENNKKIIKSY